MPRWPNAVWSTSRSSRPWVRLQVRSCRVQGLTLIPGLSMYQYSERAFHCRETQIPQEVFDEYIADLSQVFTAENYDLFRNNCNNFSNEVSTFLTGHAIPVSCTDLPWVCLFGSLPHRHPELQ